MPRVADLAGLVEEAEFTQSTLTADEFLDALLSAGLKAQDEVATLRSKCSQQAADTLAAWLVEQNELTRYQARVLLCQSEEPLLLDQYEVLDRIGAGGDGRRLSGPPSGDGPDCRAENVAARGRRLGRQTPPVSAGSQSVCEAAARQHCDDA